MMIIRQVGGDVPPTPERENQVVVDAALEGAAEIEEIAVAPRRLDQDERGRVFQQRAGLSVPGEAIGEAALHDVHAIHEATERRELGADADELRMVAIGVAGAVV